MSVRFPLKSVLRLRLRLPYASDCLLKRRQLPIFVTNMANQTSAAVYKVDHDENIKEFYIQLDDNRAKLQYTVRDDGVYDLYHTFVPPEMRGGGVAKLLAHAAFDHVANVDGKMKLTCSYLEHLNNIEKDPKYENHITSG